MNAPSSSLTIGVDVDREPVSYDPIIDGHLSVNGPVGAGKTQVLRTIASSIVSQRGTLYAFDVSDRGVAFGEFRGAARVAASLDTAVDLMGEIAAVVIDRVKIMESHDVSTLMSIQSRARPQPIIVVIDDADHLVGRWNPEVRLQPMHRVIADSLQRILYSSYAVGVRVIVGVNLPPTPQAHLQPMFQFNASLDLGPMLRGDRLARGLPGDPAWTLPRTPGEGLYRASPGAYPVHMRCTMLEDPQAGAGN